MQITKHRHIFIAVVITATVSAGFTYILVAYQWQIQPLLTAVAQNRKETERPEVELQRFRVRHWLSCVNGPVWPVGADCYSQAALPMLLSKPL